MMNYLQYFFTPSHIFSLRPPAMQTRALIILAIIFFALLLVGVFSRGLIKQTKDGLRVKALRRFSAAGFTMGLIGFIYLFFAAEGVTLLSTRFLLIVIAVVTVVWFLFIARYWFVFLPKARAEIDQQRQFKKYLP